MTDFDLIQNVCSYYKTPWCSSFGFLWLTLGVQKVSVSVTQISGSLHISCLSPTALYNIISKLMNAKMAENKFKTLPSLTVLLCCHSEHTKVSSQ